MENPIRIDLLAKVSKSSSIGFISHRSITTNQDEKAVYLLAFIQFKWLEQPVMIFVNSISQGYKLKLLLDAFRIGSWLLHRELPQSCRKQRIEVHSETQKVINVCFGFRDSMEESVPFLSSWMIFNLTL